MITMTLTVMMIVLVIHLNPVITIWLFSFSNRQMNLRVSLIEWSNSWRSSPKKILQCCIVSFETWVETYWTSLKQKRWSLHPCIRHILRVTTDVRTYCLSIWLNQVPMQVRLSAIYCLIWLNLRVSSATWMAYLFSQSKW